MLVLCQTNEIFETMKHCLIMKQINFHLSFKKKKKKDFLLGTCISDVTHYNCMYNGLAFWRENKKKKEKKKKK